MMGSGTRRFFRGIFGLVALIAVAWASAEEQPKWKLTVVDSELAAFEAVQLHAKDEGWLLTCRMRVKSLKLIAPISEVEFEGLDAAEEAIWKSTHTVRRKDFGAAYGGGRNQFLRVFLKDIPAGVVEVKLIYGSEEEAES